MGFLSQTSSHEYYATNFPTNVEALASCTHLGVGAHPDDLEVMAGHGILSCLNNEKEQFVGVTCTTGSGSARIGAFKNFDDSQMIAQRQKEQIQSATEGQFAAMLQLGFESAVIKEKINLQLVNELKVIVEQTQPQVIYTHNLMDKHQTHVAVTVHLIEALRQLDYSPKLFYGCEVWRGLDWLPDEQKVVLPINDAEKINQLIALHTSQTEGGKDYGSATVGRMRSNATFFDANQVDQSQHVCLAVNLSPLLSDKKMSYSGFVKPYVERFQKEVYSGVGSFDEVGK